MKNITLTKKLFFFTSSLLIASNVAESYWSATSSLQKRTDSAHEVSTTLNESSAKQVQTWFSSYMTTLESTNSQLMHGSSFEDITRFIKDSSTADLAYIALDNGNFVTSQPVDLPSDFDARTRGWFTEAKKLQRSIITIPYLDSVTGSLVVSVASPVLAKDNSGVIGLDLKIDTVTSDIVDSPMPYIHALIVAEDGSIIAHAENKLILKNISALSDELNSSLIKTIANNRSFHDVTISGKPYILSARQIENTNWNFVSYLDKDQYFDTIYTDIKLNLVIKCLSLLILILIFKYLIYSSFKPLSELNHLIKSLSQGSGDLTKTLPVKQMDEIGVLSTSLNDFIAKLRSMVQSINLSSEKLNVEAQTSNLVAINSLESIGAQTHELSLITVAVQEMAHTAVEVANNAELAAISAQLSSESCDTGKQIIEANKDSISNLSEHIKTSAQIIKEVEINAQEIKSIVSTISDIAEQTNLLALNAAIEAARAGEQGRGFAVVADEVRVLSQRTHNSTNEIREMIGRLQESSVTAVESMGEGNALAISSVHEAIEATKALEDIAIKIGEISEMTTQISNAANEQKVVTSEVSKNIQSVADVARKIENEIEKTEAQSNSIRGISSDIIDQVRDLKC